MLKQVLMDLSKAFDCLPHDLLIEKLSAYGLDKKVLKLLYSHLSNRKQSVRIQGYQSLLKLILGVPQGSILGPILFNLFSDLYYFINAEVLHNFADDNTLIDQAESFNIISPKATNRRRTSYGLDEGKSYDCQPSKFHTILFSTNKADTAGIPIKSKDQEIVKKRKQTAEKNYRPISLLPICGKMFEKLIFDAIYESLCGNQLLTLSQSGFRPGDSTVNQLLSITHKIYSAFEEFPSRETRAIFLDIPKAFDKVWQDGGPFQT